MRVLFDTNVVLDVLLAREPYARAAVSLVKRVERSRLEGLLCATTLTTIHYLAGRVLGAAGAREAVADLLALFEIAPVARPVLEDALRSSFKDFEDAVLNESARRAGADAIVTRNAAAFRTSTLLIYTPSELAAL